jgi:hypothetical protein
MFEFLAWEAFAVAGFAALLLTARAGVVVVAAAVAVRAHPDVRLPAAAAPEQSGEEEVAGVAASLRTLAAFGKDRLRFSEGELVDERFVDAVEDAVAPRIFPT